MNILLFGANGMLGKYVYKVLSKKYKVTKMMREDFNIESCDWGSLDEKIKENFPSIIINCAGIIPQKVDKSNISSYIKVNTLFPHKLQEISIKYNCKLIHITTDCVFSGNIGNYIETDTHDAKGIYDACVIRTSIIGESDTYKVGLLEWVRNHKNKKINGYTNHIWNGITCLTLAKIIDEIIKKNTYWKGVKHIFSSDSVSKYELCCIINKIYDLNITIIPVIVNKKDMRLSSCFDTVHRYEIKSIKNQITELHKFVL